MHIREEAGRQPNTDSSVPAASPMETSGMGRQTYPRPTYPQRNVPPNRLRRLFQRWRAFVAMACIAAAALGSACAPPAPPAPPDGWHQRSWTRDGSDATSITVDADGRAIAVAPSTNWGGNSRSIFGPKGVPQTPDQLSCATVSDAGPMTQEGLALRISDDDGRHRAITVTKNIWLELGWIYNVHLWDTNLREPLPATHVAQFNMASSVGYTNLSSRPRRLCARVINQDLTIKVWPSGQPEPSWDDPSATASATLPADWVYTGRPGLYIGHLLPSRHATFSELTFEGFPSPDSD